MSLKDVPHIRSIEARYVLKAGNEWEYVIFVKSDLVLDCTNPSFIEKEVTETLAAVAAFFNKVNHTVDRIEVSGL